MASCIVVFDDEQGNSFPYGFDDACEGAICYSNGPVAFFADRAEAKKAIKISVKFAELRTAQGKTANEDFLGDWRKIIKIRLVAGKPNT
jgi:hypothetical protein